MLAIVEVFAIFFVIFLAVYAIGLHIQRQRGELIKKIDERFCKLEEDFCEMRKVIMEEEE